MKKQIIILYLLAAAAVCSSAEESKLFVNGKGSVFAKPDCVTIEAGATTEGDSAAVCHNKNRQIMEAVLGGVKRFGLQENDIKTVQYSLNPKYEYDKATRKNRVNGYMLNHTFRLQYKDVKKGGELVDALVSAGATNINNIIFKVSDDEKYRSQARREAVKDGKRKAEELAESAGVKLERVLSIQESENNPVYPRFAMKAMMAEGAGSTPVMEGETEIASSVSIVYEIK